MPKPLNPADCARFPECGANQGSRILSHADPLASAPKLQPGRSRGAVGSARTFTSGFVLQISNPGVLIYFVAVLPQFFLPGRGVAWQVLILAVTSISVEFVVLTFYGVLAAQLGKLAVGPRFMKLANRLAGSMLVVAAVDLAKSRL